MPPEPIPDSCGSNFAQDLVGKTEADIIALHFTQPLRIIRPGQPVTEEYREGRLNFRLDAQGIITAVTCG